MSSKSYSRLITERGGKMIRIVRKGIILLLALTVFILPTGITSLAEEQKSIEIMPVGEIGSDSAEFAISCEGVTVFAYNISNVAEQKTIFNGPAIERSQISVSNLLPDTNYAIYVQGYVQGEKYLEQVASGFYQFKTAKASTFEVSDTSNLILAVEENVGYIKLNWSNDEDNVLGYYVYRSTSSGNYTTTPETDFWINGTSYTDIKIQANTSYYYIVKPVYSDKSMGNASNEVTAIAKDGGTTIELTIGNPMMTVNGIQKEIDPGIGTTPVIKDGRTCLPIRAVAEEMGCSVSYNGTDQCITIMKELHNSVKSIKFWIGRNDFLVNDVKYTMDVAPYISDTGRTMIPLRYVGDYLDTATDWDGTAKKVTLVFEKGNCIPEVTEDVTTPPTAPPTTPADIEENQSTGNTSLDYEVAHNLNWNGVWDTTHGSMVLIQTADHVQGFYDNIYYEIMDARVEGDNLVGTFKEGTDTGTFTFAMSTDEDGNILFNGEWTYNGSDEVNNWEGVKVTDDFGTVGTEWGGVWFTDWGPTVLYQNGSQVHGVYKATHLYSLRGNASGTSFEGTLDEGEGYTGQFKFIMTKAGRIIFNGEWRYDDDEDWAEWDGFKVK